MGAGTGTSQSNQQSSYTPPPWISAAGQQAVGTAQGLAQTPFSIPVQPIAGFTPQQNLGFTQAQNASGEAQPFIGAGAFGETSAGAGQYFGAEAAGVVPQLENIFGQQASQNTADSTNAAGGFGASRIGVAQGELANQQGLAAGQTLSQLFGQSATQAQTAGTNLAGIGVQGQTAGIQGAQANLAAGTQQQQQAQNVANAQYQNTLQGISWPFQTNQYLASIIGGIAPSMGGQGTQSGNVKSSNLGANLGSGSNVASGLSGIASSLAAALPAAAAAASGGRINGFADGGVPQTAVQSMIGTDNPFHAHMSKLMDERQQLTSRLNAPRMAEGGTPGLDNNPAVQNLLGGSDKGVPQIQGSRSIIPVNPVQSQVPSWQTQMMGQKLNYTVPNNIPGQGAFDPGSPNTKDQTAPTPYTAANTASTTPAPSQKTDDSISPPQQFAVGGDTDTAPQPDAMSGATPFQPQAPASATPDVKVANGNDRFNLQFTTAAIKHIKDQLNSRNTPWDTFSNTKRMHLKILQDSLGRQIEDWGTEGRADGGTTDDTTPQPDVSSQPFQLPPDSPGRGAFLSSMQFLPDDLKQKYMDNLKQHQLEMQKPQKARGGPIHAADGASIEPDFLLNNQPMTGDPSVRFQPSPAMDPLSGQDMPGYFNPAGLTPWPQQPTMMSGLGGANLASPFANAIAPIGRFFGQQASPYAQGTEGYGGLPPEKPDPEQKAIANVDKFAERFSPPAPPQSMPAGPSPIAPPGTAAAPGPDVTGQTPAKTIPIRPNAAPSGPRTAFDMTAALETGQAGPSNQGQVAPDKGGSSSYGVLGLNSKSGSAASFARSYPEFGLKDPPGTDKFGMQWKSAAAQYPQQFYDAQKEWYATHILTPVRQQLEANNVPPSVANDPRVRAYMADRRVHVGELGNAGLYSAIEGASTPEDFIHRAAAYDRANVDQNFHSRISENPNLRLGLHNRVDKRENMSLGITGSIPDTAGAGDQTPPRPPADVPGGRRTMAPTAPTASAAIPRPGQTGSGNPPPGYQDPPMWLRILQNYAGGPGTWQRVQREEIGLNRDRAAYQSSRYQQYHDVSPQQAGPAMVDEADSHRKGMGQAQPPVDADRESAGPATSGAPGTAPPTTSVPQAGSSQAPAGGQGPQGQIPITRAPETEQQRQALEASRNASALDAAQLRQAKVNQGPGMSQEARLQGFQQEQQIAERRMEMAKSMAQVGHLDTAAAEAGLEVATLPNGDRFVLDKLTGRHFTIEPYGGGGQQTVIGGQQTPAGGQQAAPSPGNVTANPAPPAPGGQQPPAATAPASNAAQMPGEDVAAHPMYQGRMVIPSRQEMAQRGFRLQAQNPAVAEMKKNIAESVLKPLNDAVSNYERGLPQLQRIDDDLEYIKKSGGIIKSGPSSEFIKDFVNHYNQAVEIMGGDPKSKIDAAGASKWEQINKALVGLAFQMSHGLTSRPAWQEVQASMNANPNATMSYSGSHALVRAMMTDGEFWKDRRDAAQAWYTNTDGTLDGFEDQANRDLSPDRYAMRFAARAALDPHENPLTPEKMNMIGGYSSADAAEKAVRQVYSAPRLGAYIWNHLHQQP